MDSLWTEALAGRCLADGPVLAIPRCPCVIIFSLRYQILTETTSNDAESKMETLTESEFDQNLQDAAVEYYESAGRAWKSEKY